VRYLLLLAVLLLGCDPTAANYCKAAKKQAVKEYKECTKENISVTALKEAGTLAVYCDRDFLVIAFCYNSGCNPEQSCRLYRVQPPKKNYSEAPAVPRTSEQRTENGTDY
jgi:hypothetical protein